MRHLSKCCRSITIPPEQVEKICAENSGGDICSDSRSVSKVCGDMAEDLLGHVVVRAYIEHINHAIRIKGEITQGCKESAGKVDARAF